MECCIAIEHRKEPCIHLISGKVGLITKQNKQFSLTTAIVLQQYPASGTLPVPGTAVLSPARNDMH